MCRPARWALAALAVGALSSSALAAGPTGGVFAGPARPNGSSGYYNPGALANAPGPVAALVETGVITGDVTYQRAGTSPFDGEPFEPVGFSLVAPTLDLSLVLPTPWEHLSWAVSGFAASAASADWPDDGPQIQHGSSALFLSYAVVTGPVLRGDNFGFAAMAGPMYTQAGLRYGIDLGAYANDAAGARLFRLEDPSLLGYVDAETSGWSFAASVGAWYEPLDGLRLGAGFLWLESPELDGELEVEPPPAFTETFPNQRFRVQSDVSLRYELPWVFNLEAEVDLGRLSLAGFFQFQNKSVQDLNVFALTETEPDILDAVVISVTNAQDDWLLGGRVSYRLLPSLELGARLDVDPRAIPKETLHATNLDFTSYEIAAGAQWQIDDRWRVAGTYAFLLVPDLVVEESIFAPTAPSDSGFAASPADGEYAITGMKFLLSVQARIGD